MAKSFIVVPAHVVGTKFHSDVDEALAEAMALVEKDRTPRVVLQLHADLRPSPTPRVDVTRIYEMSDSAEAGNG